MRIKRQQSASSGFIHSTRAWVRSSHGRRQCALAAVCGALLMLALVLVYRSGIWHGFRRPISAVIEVAQATLAEHRATNRLSDLTLDISFAAFQSLAARRDEALVKGVLLSTDDDWQKATLRWGEETISVNVRLKGDWIDHLSDKKWSFMVETRNDAAYQNMRRFSLQSPATRGYLNEWLFLSELRRSDILAPRYSFVNLTVNGEKWGVYALEESFSKELLESQQRRESVIVRFVETLLWERNAWASGSELASNWDPAANYGRQAFAEVDEFGSKKVQSDPVLRAQSDAALGLLRAFQDHTLTASEVFDTDLLGRYLAQTTLWRAGHGLVWFNERYYYNPLTTRLEPIAYDAMALQELTFRDGLAQYEDLAVAESFAKEAQRITSPEYLGELQALYGAEFERFHDALAHEFAAADLQPPWDVLRERQAMLAAVFVDQTQPVYAYRVFRDGSDGVDLQVGNLLAYPVELLQLHGAGHTVNISPEWLAESDAALVYGDTSERIVLKRADEVAPRYITLHLPPAVASALVPAHATLPDEELQLTTMLVGLATPYTTVVRTDYPPVLSATGLPKAPTLAETLAQHPFLAKVDERTLELLPGAYDVVGDLVLPEGCALTGSGATTLRFEPGAVFVVRGPMRLQAPEQTPVRLLPQRDNWAGLIVLQTDEPSLLQHVEVSGTVGIDRAGWYTTGGVTFYESDVQVIGCRFVGSTAEDALNIIRSTFVISETLFADLASDAFDGDFCEGEVRDTRFQNVRGDCVDVSGSQVAVTNISATQIGDKAVSAGEGSTVSVVNVRANDVGIAIASKDQSQVWAREVRVHRAAVAALAAYVKKLEYGTASIVVDDLLISDASTRSLVQTGSSITIDGRAQTPSAVDVTALYGLLEDRSRLQPLDYQVGSSIHLSGYYLTTPQLRAGEKVQLMLLWETDARLDQDYTVFVHMVDATGAIVAQSDSEPSGGTLPTSGWTPGMPVYDTVTINLPADAPPGPYSFLVGIYHWHTPDRPLAAIDAAGVGMPDNRIPLPVTLTVLP